ncbi:glycoside hydrolase family 16 protein [Nocardia seriolae]|uniref:Hydrolase n=1 Tax=Nocardia seriolae TaxID=37332 RepID=A0A0B8NFB4_9NOCA|nr:glycoside hydrolase family 16 protein [Nocardia seriolae]MTJ65924.1 family 16 glycosylhydrolase [Nocardia seriolae]MTJ76369.1 family 16 glycosylhydrolase [Nocardia seriolae]MTJ86150.1 family 16 glycosylhydrolase [Nocardia seriolae]MTK30146.1 family 16 glycosylhydrolase [Nocardia seriolae]MTK43920.1 family 16 glycosylhydrolase [Nocardia seriolae]
MTIARTAACATVAALLLAGCSTPESRDAAADVAIRWRQTWSDEFDGAAGGRPDPAKWVYDRGGEPQWGNAEWQYYTDRTENVSTDGKGHLVISARRERVAGMSGCPYGPCDVTSGRITTLDRCEQAYGRFEARMKIPAGRGLWPAFWLMGANVEQRAWPGNGEIVVMETVGDDPGTVHGSAHGPGFEDPGYTEDYELDGQRLADDFHTYAVEWTPGRISWFLDDHRYFTVDKSTLKATETWVFDHPFYGLLNLAVGGTWPGPPDETTVFPAELVVDYVRVYEQK